jgi:hypothetical protein
LGEAGITKEEKHLFSQKISDDLNKARVRI